LPGSGGVVELFVGECSVVPPNLKRKAEKLVKTVKQTYVRVR
jgi:hypothetical protein